MRIMWIITIGLIVLLIAIQYPLWWGPGGWLHVRVLRQQLADQQQKNALLMQRNERLAAEVKNLQNGSAAIEERARYELGMLKDGEIFVQFVSPPTTAIKQKLPESLMRQHAPVSHTPARIVSEPPLRVKPSYHHQPYQP